MVGWKWWYWIIKCSWWWHVQKWKGCRFRL